jgi:hypothetical protein
MKTARLVGVGCREGEAEMPFGLREEAWQLLERLLEHPEPTPERERESTFDPVTLSINSIRGEALHSVVRYALWVRRNLEERDDAEEVASQGFEAMPEVRHVLGQHLKPSEDPSLAVRAVYGQRFPQLVFLDQNWAEENVERIFTHQNGEEELGDAAWEAYVRYCSPYDSVFEILAEEYSRAVEHIGRTSAKERGLTSPDERLAEHLMVYYWRGKVDLTDADSLLQRFYEKASPELRKCALGFVGRSLEKTEEEVPPAILDRLRALWEARVDAVRASDGEEDGRELSAFGSWFRSGKFDETWAFEQLKVALSLAERIGHDFMVVERLAELAEEHPLEAVDCLRAIAEGQTEPWGIMGFRDEAREILKAALSSADSAARNAATDLVHRLGAMGHLDFRGDTLESC